MPRPTVDQVLALIGGGAGDDVSVSANETSRKEQTFVEMVEEKRAGFARRDVEEGRWCCCQSEVSLCCWSHGAVVRDSYRAFFFPLDRDS